MTGPLDNAINELEECIDQSHTYGDQLIDLINQTKTQWIASVEHLDPEMAARIIDAIQEAFQPVETAAEQAPETIIDRLTTEQQRIEDTKSGD